MARPLGLWRQRRSRKRRIFFSISKFLEQGFDFTPAARVGNFATRSRWRRQCADSGIQLRVGDLRVRPENRRRRSLGRCPSDRASTLVATVRVPSSCRQMTAASRVPCSRARPVRRKPEPSRAVASILLRRLEKIARKFRILSGRKDALVLGTAAGDDAFPDQRLGVSAEMGEIGMRPRPAGRRMPPVSIDGCLVADLGPAMCQGGDVVGKFVRHRAVGQAQECGGEQQDLQI